MNAPLPTHEALGTSLGEAGECELSLVEAKIYAVRINGYFSEAVAADLMRQIEAHAGSDAFAVIYVVDVGYQNYEASLRSTNGPHLHGRATAIVTDKGLLRMVVSAMGLAFAAMGKRIKAFDDIESARKWCRSYLG